ncbi:type II secretion system protein [Pseudorhodoferax aquiterrae]|uniref:Type II secretion system protein n=1 Tax=Pseudorhodoferax aquiterrae TaxID=747304 RepID=A0ABQ3FZN6_9BURK|nr:secretin N-terminal domain-containing protein [Pseudorhodoferax aquiterrae]GHC79082.1 type II secretion system protein [Pseudorhodoferax aquiterrae]
MTSPHRARRAHAFPPHWRWPALVVLALLAACASPREASVQSAQQLIAAGQVEAGLAQLERAARTPPLDPSAYNAYMLQRDAVAGVYLRDGDAARAAGLLDVAEDRYRSALRMDPASVVAQGGIQAVQADRAHRLSVAEAERLLAAGDLDGADRIARSVLARNSRQRGAEAVVRSVAERRRLLEQKEPQLRQAMARRLTLELRDVPLATIFEILSNHGGLNFVLDKDIKGDQRTTIFVRDTSLADVLGVLLQTNQLERKLLNDNTLIVYPNTQAKQREYQELVMRSFYLANADAKQTAAMIRALVKTRDLFVDERLNLVIMRDTPEAIRLAEQLVATQDLGEPEVMLELEVLEIASSVAQEIGLRFPEQIVGRIPGTGGTTSDGLVQLGSGGLRAYTANPLLILNLRQTDGGANLLANPRIRVRNREKAKVHIGEKVPVITTTSTANVGVSSAVSYLETGLKLDVEPNVYLEDEVAIKVQLEVSNILSQLNISGTVAYRLGTRNATTTLRLRDGETQVLAGLINNEDRQSMAKLPGAAELPVLGRLFRNNDQTVAKTEIVLLVTPRVLRNVRRPETVESQFASGTESVPGRVPLRFRDGTAMALTPPGAATTATPAGRAAAGAPVPEALAALGAQVPAQVGIGEEFSVQLALPDGNQAITARVQLRYDPALLAPVGGAGDAGVELSSSGMAGVAAPPATVRLRVLAKAPGQAEIGFDVASANLPVQAPPPVQIGIVQR